MSNGSIEMSSQRDGVMRDTEVASNAMSKEFTEPTEFFRSRLRCQNRCFAFAICVVLIATAVYVIGGLDMNNESSLLEKYDAQTGIVTNDFDNAKAEEAFAKAQQSKNGHAKHNWWNLHGKENPFGNENVQEHGPTQEYLTDHNWTKDAETAARERWNRTHPGQPYPNQPGHAGYPHPKGSAGNHTIGHNNNDGNVSQGTTSSNSNTESLDAKCSKLLAPYQNWYQTKITKADGVKFEILEMMQHDPKAFTYVPVNACSMM